ncbi:hypothetical protein BFP97_05465 [Roseivirga sp. 4D4]|uniref:PepSY-like domain-containing protein n=1 Tax=Roseivirga sp. 4D4 TaxID=1889784 RepID=UPI000852A411|nr:PepSY-like domain-containing protein [Roseivirga sp. 4D4]OEK00991.1 hypothetical protein BFP97_05465 [Roseivirga sp. 4D4]
MKTLRLILALWLMCLTQVLAAQIIPNKTKSVFDAKYPEATQVSWSILENSNGYQVGFIDQKKHRHAIFSTEAKWVETITIINNKRELPGLVRLTVDETYPKSSYDWMKLSEKPEGSFYVVAITSGTEENEHMLLTLTKEGDITSVSRDNKSHRKR